MKEESAELVAQTSITTGNHITIVWSDGSMTIEHVMYQCEPNNPAYDHVCISLQERMTMYTALYGPPAPPTSFSAV